MIFCINTKELFIQNAQANNISNELQELLAKMQKENSTSPKKFVDIVKLKLPQFSDGKQHDAHEFILALITVLQHENTDNQINIYPICNIEDELGQSFLFEILLLNNSNWYKKFLCLERITITCHNCNLASIHYEASSCLSINLPTTSSTLQNLFVQCLNEFVTSTCQNCTRDQLKTIKREMILTSKYMIIHLNRFIDSNGKLSKNNVPINPTSIKVKINEEHFLYEVKGVISHYGNLSKGHYTFCRKSESSWIEISDKTVFYNITPPENGYLVLLEQK